MRAVALLLAGFAATTAPAAEPVVLHVAANGDDAGTGQADRPFATVSRAREAVRQLRVNGKLPGPVTVRLAAGTYRLAAPIMLTPQDSGTPEAPIVYEAAPGAPVVLSGGRPVTGWQPTTIGDRPGWWAALPDVNGGSWYPHQLWINGERRPRARHPNRKSVFRIDGLAGANPPMRPGADRFTYGAGHLPRLGNLADVEFIALHLWVGVRMRVEAIDDLTREVRVAKAPLRRLTEGHAIRPFARYYVENASALLDDAGEWYLSRTTGQLTYLLRDDEKGEPASAVLPSLDHLLRLEGDPAKGRYVEHVTFRGLTFAHWERWPDRTDTADTQAAAEVPAGVQAVGALNCAFERCIIAHGSGYGLHLGRGCRHNRVERCEVFDTGAGGLKIGEMRIAATEADRAGENTVIDCHLHAGGKVFPQAIGVWIGQSEGNRIAHNHIHDYTYSGVSVGWTWGYGRATAGGNRVEFNHLHDIGQGLLSDMAGVYTLGAQPGTVVRNNLIHDVSAFQYGGWGIYFDEGTANALAEDNVVYRTTHGGFHQHYGKDNTVRNNVLALGREAQLRRTREEPHTSFSLKGNIIYWVGGKLLDGRWDNGHFELERNLYWMSGGEVRFGGMTLAEWQAKGRDRGSLVADPLFVDPSKGDFRVNAGSPAERIGFRMPDLSSVGVRRE